MIFPQHQIRLSKRHRFRVRREEKEERAPCSWTKVKDGFPPQSTSYVCVCTSKRERKREDFVCVLFGFSLPNLYSKPLLSKTLNSKLLFLEAIRRGDGEDVFLFFLFFNFFNFFFFFFDGGGVDA